MTAELFAVIALTTLVGAFAQGTTGLGFALILAPVVGFIEPLWLPVIVLVLMIPLNVYVLHRERHALDWSGVGWITVGRVFGAVVGLWVLIAVPGDGLNLLIGGSTVLAVLATLLISPFRPGSPALISAGVLTGVTETATGIGGPPLALVYQHHPAATLRSTMAACFLVGEILSLALLAGAGRVSLHQLLIAAALMPALLIGAWLSQTTHHRVEGPMLRGIVLAFALVSGVVLIVQG
ncbi:sulfite exporter TauE/SafE family protein [Nocardioides sp. InS609-2]|uniref:sulfite exporter TauE/SafE family protein n=1 Tax=Nocardioides sp. InS609-2 TaxID=2760705 RepID=UPI0020BF446D|nr:sulfite exporter TauE/SafE family protein [Nocardioides sp. InS609-2]